MILLTGATGKTGRAILKSLLLRGIPARVLVRSASQAGEFPRSEHLQVAVGDLRDRASLSAAIEGVESIYYICPNMTPDELEIGRTLLELSKEKKVQRFVYHSVLHPQVEAMPHHWQKMRMEELLFTSGLDFTILQPCAYMQNVLQYWNAIVNEGIYSVPYASSAHISIVDLEDVAEVAASVLAQPSHNGAIYELAGPQPLSQTEVAEVLTECLGRPVTAQYLDRDRWSANALKSGMNDYQRTTLVKMFEYYDKFGLVGNPTVLEALLHHPAATFSDFVKRQLNKGN